MVQNRDQWRAVVYTVNLCFFTKGGVFLDRLPTTNFLKRALMHGVSYSEW
jgi:hypothetical protein